MTRLILLPVLFVISAAAALAQSPAYLALGNTMQGSLSDGNEQIYSLKLKADQFVTGVVDQQTVDVVVKVVAPDGNPIDRFDGPGRGPERFQFDAEQAGVYIIHVQPFRNAEGDYAITIDRIEPIATEPAKRVDQLMAAYATDDTPGGVVGVMKDGRLVFSKAYGMANLSHHIPFKVETVTNIGSVSKQFTAFAIMLLEDRGKLSVDDDVRKHIPELPDFGKVVTLRHLLNHTGGYREVFNTLPLMGWNGEDALERQQVIDIVRNQPELQNDPGSEYNYNNTGYVLLAEVVERVTGEKFPEWMKQNVFAPLGMNSTVVKAMPGQVIANSAQGYTWGEGGVFRQTGDLNAAYGAGAIYTTVGDLAKWVNNMRDPKVGNLKLLSRMVEPAVLTTGDTVPYGFGLGIGEYRGQKLIQHSGADVAHRAMVAYYPDINGAVIVLSNNSGFSISMFSEITDMFFADKLEPRDDADEPVAGADGEDVEVPAETLEKLAGRYEAEGIGLIITYTHQDDGFYAQATGQPQLKMRALTDSTFEYVGVPATVTFHRKADGSVSGATHYQGQALPLRRLEDKSMTADELAAFTGQYVSPELETTYTISVHDGGLVATHRRLDTIRLELKTGDSFSGNSLVFSDITFERRFDGAVSGFVVSNGRTRGVRFVKITTRRSGEETSSN